MSKPGLLAPAQPSQGRGGRGWGRRDPRAFLVTTRLKRGLRPICTGLRECGTGVQGLQRGIPPCMSTVTPSCRGPCAWQFPSSLNSGTHNLDSPGFCSGSQMRGQQGQHESPTRVAQWRWTVQCPMSGSGTQSPSCGLPSALVFAVLCFVGNTAI